MSFYENYHRENYQFQRSYASDCANKLPSLAKYCVEFDKAYREFKHVILLNNLQEDMYFDNAYANLISLKKYALLEWEKNVAISVQQIKRYGNDRDKAKLKENMFWIRGTRSVDELFNNRPEDLEKPHEKNWVRCEGW